LAKTANRLAVISIYQLQPLTANHLGGGSYFYNYRLAVIVLITGSFKTAFQFGFWVGFESVLCRIFGHFPFWYKINKSKYKSKIFIKKKIQIQNTNK
jgi:hypothetical protein